MSVEKKNPGTTLENRFDKRQKLFTYCNKIYCVESFRKEFKVTRSQWAEHSKRYKIAKFEENNLNKLLNSTKKRKPILYQGRRYKKKEFREKFGLTPQQVNYFFKSMPDYTNEDLDVFIRTKSIRKVKNKSAKKYPYRGNPENNEPSKFMTAAELTALSAEIGPINPVTGVRGVSRTLIIQRIEALGFSAREAIMLPIQVKAKYRVPNKKPKDVQDE